MIIVRRDIITLKDLLNRVNEEDIDKMLIWSDWQGWANLHIIKRENDIVLLPCKNDSPFSSDKN